MRYGVPLQRRTAALLVLGLAACAPAAEEPQVSAGDALLPVKVVRTDRFIESFDGLKLDTALFAAEGAAAPQGGRPAIVLAHGGGGDKERHAEQAQAYASQGYVAMTFSSYGNGASEGEGSDIWRLAADIQSLIAWMAKNAGVNPQRVGFSGSSHGGFQSWLIALEESGVRTAIPMNSALERRKRPLTVNGVQEHWVFINHMVLKSGGLRGDRAAETKRQLSMLIDDYNNATSNWHERVWADSITEIAIADLKTPVLVRSAWLDPAVPARAMIDLYRQVPATKALMLTTGGHRSPEIPAEIFYDEARKGMWFDYWLRGIENGILDEPAVTYSIPHTENPVNPGEWMHRQFDAWPPPATPRRLYFGGGKQLVASPGVAGELAYKNNVPSKEIRLSDVDDKPLRVPELVGAPDALPLRSRGYIEALVRGVPSWQPDRVLLQSDPLTEDVEFAGHYRIHAYASSDAPEFQLNTQLLDIAADGTETVAAQGVYGVRGNKPGEIHEIEYEGLAGAHLFRKGRRIGLAISNAAFPDFKPFFTPAAITVHFSAERASFVEIPTLPAYARPPAVGGLEVKFETAGVQLDWDAVGGDVKGYKIYRNRPLVLTWPPPGVAGRLSTKPAQIGYARADKAGFLDTDAALGRDYTYLVSAVGPAGVEGPKSAAVQVRGEPR